MLPGSNHSRLVARTGYDWICVDTEHGNIDDSAMHECVAAIAGCGVSPIVRIAANEGWLVKRALDSGAHGIVVPMLYSATEAIKLVQECKFPPQGRRGFGSPFAMEKFSQQTGREYLDQANEALLTIVQIETKEALEDVENIAQVPGIDVLFIGPFDLGNNIGHPIAADGKMHEELEAAIAKILKACQKHGTHSGIFATSGDQARLFADQGFEMVSVTADVYALTQGLSGALKQSKGSYAHSAYNMAKGAAGRLASGKEQ